jgi:hypothetical protein
MLPLSAPLQAPSTEFQSPALRAFKSLTPEKQATDCLNAQRAQGGLLQTSVHIFSETTFKKPISKETFGISRVTGPGETECGEALMRTSFLAIIAIAGSAIAFQANGTTATGGT